MSSKTIQALIAAFVVAGALLFITNINAAGITGIIILSIFTFFLWKIFGTEDTRDTSTY